MEWFERQWLGQTNGFMVYMLRFKCNRHDICADHGLDFGRVLKISWVYSGCCDRQACGKSIAISLHELCNELYTLTAFWHVDLYFDNRMLRLVQVYGDLKPCLICVGEIGSGRLSWEGSCHRTRCLVRNRGSA